MTPNRTPDHRLSIEQNDPACFSPYSSPVRTTRAAWQTAEFILANPERVGNPTQALTALTQPLQAAQRSPRDSHDFCQALALEASLGPFALRANRDTPNRTHMERAEEALLPAIDKVVSISQVSGRQMGRLAQFVTYQSLLRHGDPNLFPYFAAPREEVGEVKAANHNLYVMAGEVKVPLRTTPGATKSGNLQAGVFQIKVEPLLGTVPELTGLARGDESYARCLARLLREGKNISADSKKAVTAACFFVAEAVHSFAARITDSRGRRRPLDEPIPCDAMLSNLQDFWSYTAFTQVKALPGAYSLRHGDRSIRFDRIITTSKGKDRILQLFSGPRRTWQITLPQGASVGALGYSDNVFLRKFLDHPLS